MDVKKFRTKSIKRYIKTGQLKEAKDRGYLSYTDSPTASDKMDAVGKMMWDKSSPQRKMQELKFRKAVRSAKKTAK